MRRAFQGVALDMPLFSIEGHAPKRDETSDELGDQAGRFGRSPLGSTERSRMRDSAGSDILHAGWAFTVHNPYLVFRGSDAVKSGEARQVNTSKPWTNFT